MNERCWITLPTPLVAHILYHVCYTYEKRDTVFHVWRWSRALHMYTPWFRAAFHERNVYLLWCRFLGHARTHICQHVHNKTVTLTFADRSESKFDVTIPANIPMHNLTGCVPIPVLPTERMNVPHFLYRYWQNTTPEKNHDHSSFRSITFAMDASLFFFVIHRDALDKTCDCQYTQRDTVIAGVIKDVSVSDDNVIVFTFKWGK